MYQNLLTSLDYRQRQSGSFFCDAQCKWIKVLICVGSSVNLYWLFLVVECKVKLLPWYMGILKHHLVNKLETKQCTSVLFEILRSLYASQQAVWKCVFVSIKQQLKLHCEA